MAPSWQDENGWSHQGRRSGKKQGDWRPQPRDFGWPTPPWKSAAKPAQTSNVKSKAYSVCKKCSHWVWDRRRKEACVKCGTDFDSAQGAFQYHAAEWPTMGAKHEEVKVESDFDKALEKFLAEANPEAREAIRALAQAAKPLSPPVVTKPEDVPLSKRLRESWDEVSAAQRKLQKAQVNQAANHKALMDQLAAAEVAAKKATEKADALRDKDVELAAAATEAAAEFERLNSRHTQEQEDERQRSTDAAARLAAGARPSADNDLAKEEDDDMGASLQQAAEAAKAEEEALASRVEAAKARAEELQEQAVSYRAKRARVAQAAEQPELDPATAAANSIKMAKEAADLLRQQAEAVQQKAGLVPKAVAGAAGIDNLGGDLGTPSSPAATAPTALG